MSIFTDLFKRSKTIYQGEIVFLKKRSSIFDYGNNEASVIYYDILRSSDNKVVGYADLRVKRDDEYYYYGDLGYHIYEEYRGHNYAYYACLILFRIAKEEYGFEELIITCSPDNIASYKTLEKLKGEYLETVEVPRYTELYRRGETIKCIFRYRL